MSNKYIIVHEAKTEIVVKSSKFIAYSFVVDTLEEIEKILKAIRLEYKTAKHIVYAYVLNNVAKYTDDREPSNTAGLPIYSLLDKGCYTNTLIVVVRYFGGILLGVGLLARTYQASAREVLKLSEKKEYVEYVTNKYVVPYEAVNYKLKELQMLNEQVVNIIKNEQVEIYTQSKKRCEIKIS